MAKLFANNFDPTKLAPQPPTQNINQGQSVPKQPIFNSTDKLANQKRDPFGKSISMSDRFKQFNILGSTSHLPEYTLSEYNIKKRLIDPFGKSIQLTDRYKQFSEISSTNHLPEYVLSDYNTGYLNKLLGRQRTGGRFVDQGEALNVLENASVVKPINRNFAAIIEPQTVDIQRFPFISRNSREDRSIKLKNTYEFQKDKITIPFIQIQKVKAGDRIIDPRLFIQKIRYGEVSVRNNNLILGVTVIPTLYIDKPKLNVLTIPNIQIEITSRKTFIIDPELKVKPLEQIPVEAKPLPKIEKLIYINDGFLTFPIIDPKKIRSIDLEIQADSITRVLVEPITRPEDRHGTVNVRVFDRRRDLFITAPVQNFPLTSNRRPREQSVDFSITRTGTINNPLVRHGSSAINRQEYKPDLYLGDSITLAYSYAPSIVALDNLLYNPILNSLYISEYGPQTSIGSKGAPQDISEYYTIPPRFPISSVEGGSVSTGEVRPTFSNSSNPVTYGNYYDDTTTYSQTVITSENQSPLGQAHLKSEANGELKYEPANSTLQSYSPTQPPTSLNDAANMWVHTKGTGRTDIKGDYRALSYPEIVTKRNSSERPTKDFTVGTPSSLDPWRSRLGMPDDGTGDTLYKDVDSTTTDLVKVKIGSLQFRSYIVSFSDSYTPNYADVNYIGRPDTLKVYKTTTRNVSLSFKVAAFSDMDMKGMYKKMEALVKETSMATLVGSEYVKGPMTRLTVGGWIVNAPIVISSLKLDTNPTEYTWDIQNEVPHIVDVSLDCVVLGSNGVSPTPFLTTGTYISYGA